MILQAKGNLQRLAGGLRVKARVQHPQVQPERTERLAVGLSVLR